MIDSANFKSHFVGRDGFVWWIGQIPDETVWRGNIKGHPVADNTEEPGFGERYKVRIMGYHTARKDDLPDAEVPWASVMYPTTAGGGGRGSSGRIQRVHRRHGSAVSVHGQRRVAV